MHVQDFKLCPSKSYLRILGSIGLVSFFILWWMPMLGWLKYLSLVLLAIYCVHVLLHFGLLRRASSVIGLSYLGQGKWLVSTNRGEYETLLRPDSTVTPWVAVLRFQVAKRFKRFSCVVFRDSFLNSDLYRQLMVIVRMGA